MSELPVFAIIGRPNVGKSTLFNFLTKSRQALVADYPGVTRDRQYGRGVVGGRPYWVIDTGGLMEGLDQPVETMVEKHAWQAIEEADQVFFVVDAETGLTAGDTVIAEKLRPFQKKLSLVVNKIDRTSPEVAVGDFYRLGMGEPQAISAKNGRGIEKFVEGILNHFPQPPALTSEENAGIFIAVIGRPNVGKSTLINRLLGEERVIVFDAPGTTRDSIFIPYERHGKCYTLIDTAGIRRRGRVEEGIEKFSVVKTLQAMERADVNILVFDASEGLADQDLKLLGLLLETGKGLVLAFNKWDGLSDYQKERVKQTIDRRLEFVSFARRYLISALHGTGVGDLYRAVDEAYASATKSLPTPLLTETLEQAVYDHQPPLVGNRRIRLRYAHLGGHNPLTIVIHGKQISSLPSSYRRYLANYFRKTFNLVGIPLHIELVNDKNPYVGKN